MNELKDITIEKLFKEVLSRFRKLTGEVSNLEESYNSMDKFAIKCMKELSKELSDNKKKIAHLEKSLELACGKIASIPLIIPPDFSKCPIELKAFTKEEWVQRFKEEAKGE